MKHKVLYAALAASLLLGAPVARAAPAIVASLATPITKPDTIVAAGAAWRCAETSCELASSGTVELYAACREIARKFGAVTEIALRGKPMPADRLAKCNQAVGRR